MKFRWRGGTKGFIARSAARAINRELYRKKGGNQVSKTIRKQTTRKNNLWKVLGATTNTKRIILSSMILVLMLLWCCFGIFITLQNFDFH